MNNQATIGGHGFTRIASGTTGDFRVLKAVNGDVTFGAGCLVASGDPPSNGDVLQQGDFLPGRFTKVVYTGGVLYAYANEAS